MSKAVDQRFDAVVVGAGVIGLTCAWKLSQEGMTVCVLERDRVASGATGIAAGMLAPAGEVSWGEERLLELSLASHRLWPSFAEELAVASGVDPGFEPLGALHVAMDRDEAEELRRKHELHGSLGLDSEWLRPGACRALEPGLGRTLAAGLHASGDAAVDPIELARALVSALRVAGGELLEGAEAVSLITDGGGTSGVQLADGAVRADAVVVATGCWAGASELLPEAARPPVRPVKGEILTLRDTRRRAGAVCGRIVAGERFYCVPRRDGRLIVGATVEERGFDQRVTAEAVHELLRESRRALPDVGELEFVSADARLRPGTPDNAPVIGTSEIDGVILATGHYRNGILQAPITAAGVTALVTGKDAPAELAPFGASRFRRSPAIHGVPNSRRGSP